MRQVGSTFRPIIDSATCQLKGRVFSFGRQFQKLMVREVHLGDKAWVTEVNTHAEIGDSDELYIKCCSLGDAVLVIAGETAVRFAALFRFQNGKLGKNTFSMKKLAISGTTISHCAPGVCSLNSSTVLFYYMCYGTWLYGRVGSDSLSISTVPGDLFSYFRASSVPLDLQDGSLIAASTNPKSAEIWRFWPFAGKAKGVGRIPGVARTYTSTALIANRFMVGFGGSDETGGELSFFNDLWVFDSVTGKSSRVRRSSLDWHPQDDSVYLAVHGKYLYLIGGTHCRKIYRMALTSLGWRIQHTSVRLPFQDAIGTKQTYMTLASYAKKLAKLVLVL